MSLKEIQNKLLLWDSAENPLAPLTSSQRETILDIESIVRGLTQEFEEDPKLESDHDEFEKSTAIPSLDTSIDFFGWYENVCELELKANDATFDKYYKQLEDRGNECDSLLNQINATLSDLNQLSAEYKLVSNKTNALHTMSEQLLADQNKLSIIGNQPTLPNYKKLK